MSRVEVLKGELAKAAMIGGCNRFRWSEASDRSLGTVS
jgi:hypothetical protein